MWKEDKLYVDDKMIIIKRYVSVSKKNILKKCAAHEFITL